MATPVKPKKIRRNQPTDFKETFAPALPQPGLSRPLSAAPSPRRLSARQMRLGLYGLWAAAAIFAGIGIGRLILTANPRAGALKGVPVAKAAVRVADVLSLT